MRRRRLVTAAVIGAFAAGVSTIVVATAPLMQQTPAMASPRRVSATSAAQLPYLPPGVAARIPRRPPLVIAHRGAAAYLPEHTLESYRLAVAMGADYIEADLVPTKDGVLVARHENELSATTDVAHHPEFLARKQTKRINGAPVTGWFTEDFTLAELRTLRAVQRTRARGGAAGFGYSGRLSIPSLQQVIDLVRTESASRHRTVGLYLELKVPGYFTSIGLAPEPRLAETLRHNRLAGVGAPVYIESFEPTSLRTMHRLVQVPLVQLVWGGERADPDDVDQARLAAIHEYATVIGIDRGRLRALTTAQSDTALAQSTELVRIAHAYGLEVHVFTFANDTVVRPAVSAAYLSGDPTPLADALAEYRAYFRLGVDGVFTDNPDTAVRARG